MKKHPTLSKSYLYLFLFTLVAAAASFSLVRVIDDFGTHLEKKHSAVFDEVSGVRP